MTESKQFYFRQLLTGVDIAVGDSSARQMANFIYEQAISLQNFPMGAASSFILLFVTLLIIFLINKVFEKKIRGLPSN